jgi:dephospho-CoA kinase
VTAPAPGVHYVGLTGPMGGGKGEVVALLQQLGFTPISLSDIVRERVRELGRPVDRYEMQDIGNSLRREGGSGVLGLRVRQRIERQGGRWVIDGIRNPAEVSELRRLPGFLLVAVTAPTATLVERMLARGRDTDRADEAELRRRLAREWGEGEPEGGQQVGPCVALADETLVNDGSLAQLQAAAAQLLRRRGVV